MSPTTILVRFALAFAGAFLFGLIRQRLRKPIGFGTFIFLAVGSCSLSLTAIGFSPDNPLPLLGAIVTGVGFLGAGALFRTTERVTGFTSAATIWIFAVIGLTLGLGEYLVSGLVYAAIWIVTLVDRMLERRWIGAHQRTLTVEVPLGTSDEFLGSLGLPKSSMKAAEVDRDEGKLILSYSLSSPPGDMRDLVERLQNTEVVRRATVEVD